MQFRTKIFIGSVVAALVSLVASELWLAWQVREERQAGLVQHLTAEARLIGHSLEGSRPDVDLDRVAHDWARLAQPRDVDRGGRKCAGGLHAVAGGTRPPRQSQRSTGSGGGACNGIGQVRRYSDTVDIDMLYVAVSVNHPLVRFVRLAMPAAEMDAQLGAVRRLRLVALAVGVPLALLVAWISTAPLARRVQDIAGAASAYKAGDFARAP